MGIAQSCHHPPTQQREDGTRARMQWELWQHLSAALWQPPLGLTASHGTSFHPYPRGWPAANTRHQRKLKCGFGTTAAVGQQMQ